MFYNKKLKLQVIKENIVIKHKSPNCSCYQNSVRIPVLDTNMSISTTPTILEEKLLSDSRVKDGTITTTIVCDKTIDDMAGIATMLDCEFEDGTFPTAKMRAWLI
jgi:hypothetical protein